MFHDRCSHCRKLAPTWKELAEFHKDNMDITIAKVHALVSAMLRRLIELSVQFVSSFIACMFTLLCMYLSFSCHVDQVTCF